MVFPRGIEEEEEAGDNIIIKIAMKGIHIIPIIIREMYPP